MDNQEIKKAFDAFETENFVEAKNILSQQIKQHKQDWLVNKLNLKKPLSTAEKE